MNTCFWLQPYLQQWQTLILHNKAPHALLLYGASGLGKVQLAQYMAHIAVCENLSVNGVCQNCKGCHLFNAGNHTDVRTIAAEKETIKVEQIRQLCKKVVLSSGRNHNRVVIIEQAEKMNKASANALLKTLEEPPANVILLLTTNDIGFLLPTIKSRCFKWNIQPPESQQLQNYLHNCESADAQAIKQAIILANGAPLLARSILHNNTLVQIQSMLRDLGDIIQQQKTVLDICQQWIKNQQTEYLNLIAAYFLAVLKGNNGLGESQELAQLSPLDYWAISDYNKKILGFVQQLFAFNKGQKTALKTELLLEELLIQWKNAFQS